MGTTGTGCLETKYDRNTVAGRHSSTSDRPSSERLTIDRLKSDLWLSSGSPHRLVAASRLPDGGNRPDDTFNKYNRPGPRHPSRLCRICARTPIFADRSSSRNLAAFRACWRPSGLRNGYVPSGHGVMSCHRVMQVSECQRCRSGAVGGLPADTGRRCKRTSSSD